MRRLRLFTTAFIRHQQTLSTRSHCLPFLLALGSSKLNLMCFGRRPSMIHGFISTSIYDVMSFLLFLRERLSSPSQVMNYFSAVKTSLQCAGFDTSVFESYQVKTLKQGICKNSSHMVTRATPLTSNMLINLVRYLTLFGSGAWMYIASILMSYFTLARQSNVFSLSSSQLGLASVRLCLYRFQPARYIEIH